MTRWVSQMLLGKKYVLTLFTAQVWQLSTSSHPKNLGEQRICTDAGYIYIFGTLQQLNWQWKLSIFWRCKTPERVNFHQNGETSDRPRWGTWEAPRIKPYQEWPSEPVLLFFWHIMASHGTISVAFPSLKHFSNIHTHIVYIICAGFWKWGIPNTMGFNTKKMDDVGVPPF